eukprot:TRINITY_DN4955_c0_g1_i1.p2 TRINITY_DN4955_c0_g1~~TRINITY_DN4955_c0_g1_i1.p2  ORF type:complete len:339 (+),score=87.00 TRINITY_DN4955_c0_g1_i1:2416-3432(+)
MYVEELRMLKDILERLADAQLMSRSDFRIVVEYFDFGSVLSVTERIIEVMTDLYEGVSDDEILSLSSLFSTIGDGILSYQHVCSNLIYAKQFGKDMEMDGKFKQFWETQTDCNSKKLTVWFNLMYSHILRYPTEVQEFISVTPSASPDYKQLENSFTSISDSIDLILRVKDIADNQFVMERAKIEAFQDMIITEDETPISVLKYNRKFITEVSGREYNKKKKRLTIILFSDLLLITQPKKSGHVLKSKTDLNDLTILDYVDAKRNVVDDVIRIQTRSKSFDVQFEDIETKTKWDLLLNQYKKKTVDYNALTEKEKVAKNEKKENDIKEKKGKYYKRNI